MKKRKTYEISVIDKTYSKTISDKTKFYASDTALELVFKLKETEYTFESAEIVLLNTGDRSRTTRPVPKVNDDFVYEIDNDVVTHYGDWLVQLIFEQAGEFYVSSPVKFRIENDLSNEHPPQLSDIYSWTSLKRYADKLTEDLKQAVLSVEGIEDTFNTNELGRQTTFETSESERDETFSANETTRQAQELEREKAEIQRQSEFEDNEASRDETFNANEVLRQENESARQQAESQRQSTFETKEIERQTTFETAENDRESEESNRVRAENQRKIDHEGRSAELGGKADKVVIKNLLPNGYFVDGIDGWDNVAKRFSVVGYKDGGVTLRTYTDKARLQYNLFANDTDIYYFSAEIESDSTGAYLGSQAYKLVTYDNPPERQKLSYLGLVPNLHLSLGSNDVGAITTFYKAIAMNLTETFGAGNEPTKEEMDELIKVTGYIDEEYALNNKEMLGHLMKGIGEKANKNQEDWITPTLLNGWQAQTGVYQPLRYMKDEFGFVHIHGQVLSPESSRNVIFELPLGYRGDRFLFYPVTEGLGGRAVGQIYIDERRVSYYTSNTAPETRININLSFKAVA